MTAAPAAARPLRFEGGDQQLSNKRTAALKSETLFFMDDFLFYHFVPPFFKLFLGAPRSWSEELQT